MPGRGSTPEQRRCSACGALRQLRSLARAFSSAATHPLRPVALCHPQLTADDKEFLGRLMRGQGRERIVGGPAYSSWFNTQSRLTGALPQAGVQVRAGG